MGRVSLYQSAAHFEANLAELLPDCIPLGTMSWIRGYGVNDPCRLVGAPDLKGALLLHLISLLTNLPLSV